MSSIISAKYVAPPAYKPELFPGRPWVVYYEDAVRDDGKRRRWGMRSFISMTDAMMWRTPLIGDDVSPDDLISF